MDASIRISGDAAILSVEKEHEQYRYLIAGGTDGVLAWIDQEGHVRVGPPEGPLPVDRVREGVRLIIEGTQMLTELAHDTGAAFR
jgi:hypothetical protein